MYKTNHEIHNITTRSNKNLHPPVCNLTVFQKGAYYSGINLFNHLPRKIKSLLNEIKLCKPALKMFLNAHSFYSVEDYLQYSFNYESWFLYRDHWKCIYNSSLIILNFILYKYCTLEIYFDTNYCLATKRMITCMKSCFVLGIFNNMTISISLWFL